ncbi:MAG: hypothetical protein JWM96_629 [Alphaproteobacteria bacterium]|nr:hypothetical protein [Alphaproteobacteria bacterium]
MFSDITELRGTDIAYLRQLKKSLFFFGVDYSFKIEKTISFCLMFLSAVILIQIVYAGVSRQYDWIILTLLCLTFLSRPFLFRLFLSYQIEKAIRDGKTKTEKVIYKEKGIAVPLGSNVDLFTQTPAVFLENDQGKKITLLLEFDQGKRGKSLATFFNELAPSQEVMFLLSRYHNIILDVELLPTLQSPQSPPFPHAK